MKQSKFRINCFIQTQDCEHFSGAKPPRFIFLVFIQDRIVCFSLLHNIKPYISKMDGKKYFKKPIKIDYYFSLKTNWKNMILLLKASLLIGYHFPIKFEFHKKYSGFFYIIYKYKTSRSSCIYILIIVYFRVFIVNYKFTEDDCKQ